MVAIVIIVLLIGMALPVFRVITGSRSEAGASNIIAATLARARADAVGLQKPIGVAFLYNRSTQKQYMAEVTLVNCPAWVAGQQVANLGYVSVVGTNATYYYINNTGIAVTLGQAPTPTSEGAAGTPTLAAVYGPPIELRNNTDLIALPTGIGVQTICNCSYSGTTRLSDGYLSVGVILFDGKGRIATQNYGISQYSKLLTSAQFTGGIDYPGINVYTGTKYQYGIASQYGLVVFQKDAFVNQAASTMDAVYLDSGGSWPDYTSGSPSQQSEENWLDQNATPLLIDRYTGTLIKAE
jgi:hypothetical protein